MIIWWALIYSGYLQITYKLKKGSGYLLPFWDCRPGAEIGLAA
ncbi:hypothetical protein AB434_0640 [Heyndrickxia coagulans]|uniref:Uncharacterized protein n=1 Tax=Heyndrickxia coagulans TaxID=1398 RepID=A0AAN0T400_HEYCO|nr:hypothetical protein SB48_HM08orf00815 [Heyndrickxia coagulans]AKN53045.1 hypothetical protein AB434_0640 [Heyndrickxia coagulans]KYC62393.1 hypothetical protein B4100_1864 [Heyndrickxia coagulans]